MSQFGFEAQLRIYSSSLEGKTEWPWPTTPEEWKALAKRRLPAGPWGYLEGGAGRETTMDENEAAFRRYKIRSRMMRDVSERDLSISVLGHSFDVPFLLAPIGVQSILHTEGELASAAAAAASNVPFVLSTVSSFPMEQVASVMGEAPRWFQLYPGRDESVVHSFLSRAEKASYTAIVVTVDTTMLGWRCADLKNVYLPFLQGEGIANFVTDPAFARRLTQSPQENPAHTIQEFLSVYVNPAFTWHDLSRIRNKTSLPILVKGITHPEDAREAQRRGMDGVIVSNHGGRQVDGGVSALDALVEIRCIVGEDYPLLMDSGIRSGADVCKAIALGANAVLVGRPYAYALAAGGRVGVEEWIHQFKAELDLQLALSGYRSIRELPRDYAHR